MHPDINSAFKLYRHSKQAFSHEANQGKQAKRICHLNCNDLNLIGVQESLRLAQLDVLGMSPDPFSF